jgi:hypothetical protein
MRRTKYMRKGREKIELRRSLNWPIVKDPVSKSRLPSYSVVYVGHLPVASAAFCPGLCWPNWEAVCPMVGPQRRHSPVIKVQFDLHLSVMREAYIYDGRPKRVLNPATLAIMCLSIVSHWGPQSTASRSTKFVTRGRSYSYTQQAWKLELVISLALPHILGYSAAVNATTATLLGAPFDII